MCSVFHASYFCPFLFRLFLAGVLNIYTANISLGMLIPIAVLNVIDAIHSLSIRCEYKPIPRIAA